MRFCNLRRAPRRVSCSIAKSYTQNKFTLERSDNTEQTDPHAPTSTVDVDFGGGLDVTVGRHLESDNLMSLHGLARRILGRS